MNKRIMTLAATALVFGFAAGASAQDAPPSPPPGGPQHHGGPDGHGMKRFERLDEDKDGKVSKDEFMKAQDAHFAKMDADGDGFFTREEAEAMKQKMREMRKERKDGKPGDVPPPSPEGETGGEEPEEPVTDEGKPAQ